MESSCAGAEGDEGQTGERTILEKTGHHADRALSVARTYPTMAHIFVALFLILFGLNMLAGLSLPLWLLGALAVIAGVLLLIERFGGKIGR